MSFFKKIRFFLLLGGVLIILFSCFFVLKSADDFYNFNHQIKLGDKIINVALAKNKIEQFKGLSNRKKIGDDQGMLFIFSKSNHVVFWMKDMLFDLDLIFIKEGKIVEIKSDFLASSYNRKQKYYSKNKIDMVLEVNKGLVKKNNWRVGDEFLWLK